MYVSIRWIVMLIVPVTFLASDVDPVWAQAVGPIVGKAVKGDTSKPLRELAEEAKQAQIEADKAIDKHQRAVLDYLKDKHPSAARGELAPLSDTLLAKTFPKAKFYTLRFRQWPVAFEVPKGLKPGNVCVLVDDKVTLISDAKGLEKFAAATLKATDTDDQRQAAAAWLRLSQELHQDGFFKFKDIDIKAIKVDGRRVSGKTEVEPAGGNSGQISGTLTFSDDGTIKSADCKAQLREGVRPICQATKLLDADAIVRRMAERDILIIGRGALPYLLEQRAKASDELQSAIDGLWEQILADGR